MSTPKGMRAQHITTVNGDAVHIYSDKDKVILQLRHEVPTERNVLATSFKAAVELSDEDILAIAGELLTVVSLRMKQQNQTKR